MTAEAPDPEVVEVVAVTEGDVVAALEANRTTSRRTVIRLTPPFAPRMRGRLHRVTEPAMEEARSVVHLDPASFVADDAPRYPSPDDTATALRSDPQTAYTLERHRRRHEAAVDAWRSAVADALRDGVRTETDHGTIAARVVALAGGPGHDGSEDAEPG
jgi:hypothetical protein